MRARVLLRLLLPCSLLLLLLLLLLYAVPAKSEARTKRGGRRRKRVAPPAQQRKKQQDGGTMYGFDPASVPVVPWVAEKLQTEPQRWNAQAAANVRGRPHDPLGREHPGQGEAADQGPPPAPQRPPPKDVPHHAMDAAGIQLYKGLLWLRFNPR